MLVPGEAAPTQTTATTCGSACLVVARMLADPAFEAWVERGDAGGRALPFVAATAQGRFAAYEAVVKERTVSARGLEGAQLPWPGFWGTPPWGAVRELAAISGLSARDYRVDVIRWKGLEQREKALRALLEVEPGRPALLYVGSARLPRHVCLVARAQAGTEVVVYEPSAGEVRRYDPAALATGTQTLGGWPHVWLVIAPR